MIFFNIFLLYYRICVFLSLASEINPKCLTFKLYYKYSYVHIKGRLKIGQLEEAANTNYTKSKDYLVSSTKGSVSTHSEH